MAKNAQVVIIMGSESDLPTMNKVSEMLSFFEIYHTLNIYSAHRTPVELSEFIEAEVNNNPVCKVVIAGAGMSAALAGIIAAETLKPVIGIPLSGGKFHGVDSLLSTIEMPPGNPVLTVGVDAVKNAALAAVRIIALNNETVSEKLEDFKNHQSANVIKSNAMINGLRK